MTDEQDTTSRAPDATTASVRAEIARRGMRQTAVAEAAGLSRDAWRRRIRGEVSWRLDELRAIARHLDVELSTLTGDGT